MPPFLRCDVERCTTAWASLINIHLAREKGCCHVPVSIERCNKQRRHLQHRRSVCFSTSIKEAIHQVKIATVRRDVEGGCTCNCLRLDACPQLKKGTDTLQMPMLRSLVK